ncbi:MAG: YqgE/AlgH family protein [Gammaproteobacteria bacterium]|nr:YqgE/AlgH family protein [Gammaproteobacteria bacterium]
MSESKSDFPSLSNQLLVSMPLLDDPNFAKTVILICQHNEDGAMGIVVNRVLTHSLGDIFLELSLPITDLSHMNAPVYDGGPVQREIGFVIHNGDKCDWDSSISINDSLCLTTSRDILSAMAEGKGPQKAVLGLGYAGWGPGQLEEEIKNNAWFSTPADADIIFLGNIDDKWHNAAGLLGIDYRKLSSQVGHA